MRSSLLLALTLGSLLLVPLACSDEGGSAFPKVQCNDGEDNDADGMVDFPDDLGCTGEDDESEDSLASPQCDDGRDNDGDGETDYPNDPGCFAPNQDDETDDCPDGPTCPQCSDGEDNDMNGSTDFPNDSGGCESASDTDEYTQNPAACGSNITIKKLPIDGHVDNGMLDATVPSSLTSPACGGAGHEDVYELRITAPKVVVATTNSTATTADTVLYIRSANCVSNDSELACNDDIETSNKRSSVTQAISTPGTYYLVVDAHNAGEAGAYDLQVDFFVGEGVECQVADDCGPGLVCRVPKNGTTKVCAKHVCEDGLDEDDDGKNDYPQDPGCTDPKDDDETDGCPGVGPNCPECADGFDNDTDGMSDFPGDTTCSSASSASEACVSTDGVVTLTAASTMGTTIGAVNDVKVSCATTGTHTAPDKTYRLDVPPMSSLVIENVNTMSGAMALYNSTCTGTPVQCSSYISTNPEKLTLTNLAAGTYYYVVDGYSTGSGAYTINVSGKIQNGQSCEGALAQSGAITCGLGYACVGTAGSRTCQQAQCLDGNDNDSDGKADYPHDPGCETPADTSEANPATPAVCSDTNDNEPDGMTDWPNDFGCIAAGGATEVFCTGETDAPTLVLQKTTTGTTAGKANDWAPTSCQGTSNAPDIAFALQLPVPVATLEMDTNGSGIDTVMQFRDAQCGSMLQCDDDGGLNLRSKITMSNLIAGGYAIIVDGYNTNNGAITLNVRGTVAAQTPCTSPLFTGGANAVLVCPTGTSCTGGKCQ